jgi:ApbE superfamily uncharacterized protein (UPF0280 family)
VEAAEGVAIIKVITPTAAVAGVVAEHEVEEGSSSSNSQQADRPGIETTTRRKREMEREIGALRMRTSSPGSSLTL